MTRRILIHENAAIDIHEHFGYLAQNNQDPAFRFFDAARQTFAACCRTRGASHPRSSQSGISKVYGPIATSILMNKTIYDRFIRGQVPIDYLGRPIVSLELQHVHIELGKLRQLLQNPAQALLGDCTQNYA